MTKPSRTYLLKKREGHSSNGTFTCTKCDYVTKVDMCDDKKARDLLNRKIRLHMKLAHNTVI